MLYVSNAFSLGMITVPDAVIKVKELKPEEVKNILEQNTFTSSVGHASTSSFLTQKLHIAIPVNRIAVTLTEEDTLIVCQLLGRLEEGKILSEQELETFPVKFYLIKMEIS